MPFALKFRQTERKRVFWLFMCYEGRNWLLHDLGRRFSVPRRHKIEDHKGRQHGNTNPCRFWGLHRNTNAHKEVIGDKK